MDDQIYFSISDSDKNSSEQLTDDSQGKLDSRQVNALPPINTSILHISTEFVTENLCGSISKENNLIPPLNTDSPQVSDNLTVPSIPANCNTPQLANIVDKSITNQATEKIEGQLIAMKSDIKCEISNIDQKFKSLYSVRETSKINMPVNEKTGKCKGFAFALVSEQKEILKLNGITSENRIIAMKDATSTRMRDTQNVQKTSERPL